MSGKIFARLNRIRSTEPCVEVCRECGRLAECPDHPGAGLIRIPVSQARDYVYQRHIAAMNRDLEALNMAVVVGGRVQ